MLYRNLKDFIVELQHQNELIVIDTEVDPYLEIAEIHRRVIAANGPALLFTKVKGKTFPVVTNLFGSVKRVNLAFGTKPQEFVQQVAQFPHTLLPPSLSKLWGHRSTLWQSLSIGTKQVQNAPVLQNSIPHADLTQLPAITSWIEDGGPFLTLPLVHTQGKKKPHSQNLGMYRIQIFDAQETGMHFQIGKGGGFHLAEAEELMQDLPVNIYLGGPPALIMSAIAPLPEHVPELLLASLLMGEKIKQVRLPSHPLPAIAEAEFCLSGTVPAHVRRPEGPFGDHYGYYSLIHDFPVFRPQKIYHRHNAIFPATVVGKPRQEDFYLGDYLQELLSPLFPVVMPQITQLWSYGETGFHSLSAAVVKERYEKEAMTAVFRILGEGQLSLSKFLWVIDKPMDLKDFKAVLTHLLERFDPRSDLIIFSQLSMDTLDYSGGQLNKGSKGAMLGMGAAKRSLPREFHSPNLPPFVRKVQVFCPGCLVVEISDFASDKDGVQALASHESFAEWPLLVAVDDLKKTCQSNAAFLWTCFTRFDPASDLYAAKQSLGKNRVVYEGSIAIDARMKPWYPKELFCDDDTRRLVDKRWNEYFPSGKVEMGSSDYGHL